MKKLTDKDKKALRAIKKSIPKEIVLLYKVIALCHKEVKFMKENTSPFTSDFYYEVLILEVVAKLLQSIVDSNYFIK